MVDVVSPSCRVKGAWNGQGEAIVSRRGFTPLMRRERGLRMLCKHELDTCMIPMAPMVHMYGAAPASVRYARCLALLMG